MKSRTEHWLSDRSSAVHGPPASAMLPGAMCLAVPGELIERREGTAGLPFGRVRFGSVVRDVCLAYVPEASPGDYLIVHVGFAIQRLDEEAARRALSLIEEGLESGEPDSRSEEPSA